MWNKNRSILLTHVIVRACYVLLAAAIVGLPILLKGNFQPVNQLKWTADFIICSFFAVVPAGYVALVCLDKILINVKREVVFSAKNVKLLRIISWACFYAGLIGALTFAIMLIKMIPFVAFLFALANLTLAIAEMFMGLVVRVVKNIFEKAIEIKDENELTI